MPPRAPKSASFRLPDRVQCAARRALIAAVCVERFASGLLTSLLVFQLSERWGLTESRAAAWVGYFLAASYMTPLAGGLLCDRGLPARAACVVGCLGIALGYAALLGDRPMALILGSGCLLGGAGLFRPGVQLLLDQLCAASPVTHDPREPSSDAAEPVLADAAAAQTTPRKDEAYTWMHALVNIGGMLAPLVSERLQNTSGFAAVSALAVVCMLLAIGLIQWGVPHESDAKRPVRAPATPAAARGAAGSSVEPARGTAAGDLSPEAPLSPGSLLSFCGALMGFWMVYAQCSSTLLLWARDRVDRRVQGFELPVSVVAALPWGLVVVLTPLLLALFRVLRRQKREPDTLRKLRLGFMAMAVGFAALCLSGPLTALGVLGRDRAPMAWLLLALVAITVGELCVAPLGPVLLLRVAPRRLRGLVTALWFSTLGIGFVAGGALADLWGTLSPSWFFAVACALTLVARTQVTRGFYHSGNLDTLPPRLCHG